MELKLLVFIILGFFSLVIPQTKIRKLMPGMETEDLVSLQQRASLMVRVMAGKLCNIGKENPKLIP